MSALQHNNIERSKSRIWKKSYLNRVVKECKAAGFDVISNTDTITIGIIETDQVFLKALRGTAGWLTRYDQKLFDASAEG
jgi:hypothetical protein